jgi:hypothetical protein
MTTLKAFALKQLLSPLFIRGRAMGKIRNQAYWGCTNTTYYPDLIIHRAFKQAILVFVAVHGFTRCPKNPVGLVLCEKALNLMFFGQCVEAAFLLCRFRVKKRR